MWQICLFFPIYLVDYFYQYGFMHIYFIHRVVIQHEIIFFAQILPVLAIGSSFRLTLVFLLHKLIFIYLFIYFLALLDFWHYKMLQAHPI